jgi:hypothetical protein
MKVRKLSDRKIVSRTASEVKEEAKKVYNSVYDYIKENHHENSLLSILAATAALSLEFYKAILLYNVSRREKETADEIMERVITRVHILRYKAHKHEVEEDEY